MITPEDLRRRRQRSLTALAPSSSLENSDLFTITDEGELGADFPFSLIETQPELFTITDEPDTDIDEAPAFTGKSLMLAEIALTGGTLFRAGKGIRHPTRFYVGKVKSFGNIIRSMPVPTGLPDVGDAVLSIIDTDGTLRQEADVVSMKNREVVMKIGTEGESEDIFQVAYTGKIETATFDPGVAQLFLKDNTFQFFELKLADLLTRENFIADPLFAKNLIGRTEGRFDEREIFSPIVFGIVSSDNLEVIGAMNAVRLDSTTFNLAQHPIPHDPIRIFIKDPEARPIADQSFVELVGGFSIVEVEKTIEGVDYTFTHVVFGSARADGFEVRWDGEGMTDDGTKDGTVVRNPSACIKLYLTRIAQQDESTTIDELNFALQAVKLATVDTGGAVPGLFCDGAIVSRMTHREAIARLTRSFGIFIFTNKRGLISIRYITGTEPERTILTDVQDIYEKSEVHSLARPVFNEVDLQFSRAFSDQSWGDQLVLTDEDGVTDLGRVESVDLKLFFVRDINVADKVARDFLQFTAPKSYRIMFTVPGHRRTQDIELGQIIGITNHSGIDQSGLGYLNKEFLLYKTEFNTDTKQLKVHAVARVPSLDRTRSQASEWVTITNGSGSGVEGDYEELIASTSALGTWVLVQVRASPQFIQDLFEEFDLAIGPPGDEVNFVNDMLVVTQGFGVGSNPQQDFSFPFRINPGSRISARTKGTSLRAYQIIVHVNG